MRAMGGLGVVTPHDGMVNSGDGAGFCGFYYYSREYVERHHHWGTAFRTDPLQCYWVDTEFCLRAASLGLLRREPRCCVLHLHWTNLPASLQRTKSNRAVRASSSRDGLIFIERMRDEGIDPWRHIPDLATFTPEDILDEMETLRGIKTPTGAASPAMLA